MTWALLICCLKIIKKILKKSHNALQCPPMQKKKLKKTKSIFLKDHSKNMIMDGTCHIVEDNMAKDKIFTIKFSAIKALRSDRQYYMKMLI